MLKLSPIALSIGALISTSALAQSIEGVVQDANGNAIYNASVVVKGTSVSSRTDESGRFFIDPMLEGERELHISAEGYAHLYRQVSVANDESESIRLTLKRSPIEVIDIVASPLHMSAMESASPVSVLGAEELRRQQSATLGDTLEKTPGVHTNFHGKVASTPVIRGLSGPRVLIAQNGLDVSDVSRVGPDHSVASEASTAQQIEVLRGPATLFYGSGAIGGVVNVVDGRVPTDNTTRGEWLLETHAVDDSKLGSFNVTTGSGPVAFYADGYSRESNDYEVPVAPDIDSSAEGDGFKVENSGEESDGFTLGTSYLFDQGYVGVAVEQFNRTYGIPGHTHGGDEEHAHDEEHGHENGHSEEEAVFADLEQTRIQLLSEINFDNAWFSQLNTRAAFTDYEHAEVEHGAIGTTFENETQELRLDLSHQEWAGWTGALSFHYKNSDVAAQGSEAFTPPSETQTLAVAVMEERHFGDVLVQFGARTERVELEASSVLLPEIDVHAHDPDGHNEHAQHGDEHSGETRVFDVEHEFTPVSLSAGLVWDFTPGYNFGVSLSRSQRASSASELLSFGPHIGTRTYEVGALFALHNDGGHQHFGLTEQDIDLETANNIDLTLRKTDGDIGFILNAFYNQVDNYYYQTATELFAPDGHDHGDEHNHHAEEGHDHGDEHNHHEEAGHDHAGELPVYLFQSDDVVLHGFEAQVAWQATDAFKTTFFSDYVRARLKDGGELPRTSPFRFGAKLSYQANNWTANLDITRYQEQDNVATRETATDGYTMLDVNVLYDLPFFNRSMAVYLDVNNLTDTEARVHTSFLKDIAPRPGRSIGFGVKGSF
ncbi:TonB-dependent receptor [Idiomarina aminovorans]|uniref:TonB-dependent receptor n=1 Tax=Idiomarina aminovorans TaxID=2914829 RepID=UPI002002A746|nr:TonB-dependent receptor [Idiomarina sp. ATCH4]MCK7460176.1 TonB-dependent receptor [Idiomarina sp. ATCH4]